METSKLSCIVHYNIKGAKYSKIKGISDTNEDRIYEAKFLREKLRGKNHHEVQCNLISANIDHSQHGVHADIINSIQRESIVIKKPNIRKKIKSSLITTTTVK